MKSLLSLPMLVALGLGLSIQAASADWEYTRWGMTPEEVVKASSGEVAPQAPGDRMLPLVLAAGTYTRRGVTWRASFEFTPDNRLKAVRLSLDEPLRCDAAMDSSTMEYGPYKLMSTVGSGLGIRSWPNGRIGYEESPAKPDRLTMYSRIRTGLTGPYLACEFLHEPAYGVMEFRRKQADAR